MDFVINSWDAISRSGITNELNASETKRVKLTNRFGVIAVLFTLPYIIGFAYHGYYDIACFSLLLTLIYSSVPFLTRFGQYNAAKVVLYLTVLVHQFVVASVFGEEADIHLMYIALVLLPIVLYDYKSNIGWISFYTLATLTALFMLYYTDFSMFRLPVSGTVILVMNIAYKVSTIAGVIVILCTSLYLGERAEKSLDADNLFLQYQLQAIYDNSSDAIFLVNSDSKIIKANKRAVELFEMESEASVVGCHGLDFHRQPLAAEELNEMHLELLNNGQYESEFLYKTEKGKEFWGAISIKVIMIREEKYCMIRITDVTHQHKVSDKLKASLHEKEILLAEIHHRVKNNLAVISGLLGLQSGYIEDKKAKELFEESRDRIHSMALIHDKLYQHETFAKINFCAYISDLVNYIRSSYNAGDADIDFQVTCNDIFLDIQNAVPCGLILNELISNSCKHAFRDKKEGQIRIVCSKMGERFTMMVSDNGIGFDAEAALVNPASLGLTLINALVEQLSGTLKTTHHNGTSYYISFEA